MLLPETLALHDQEKFEFHYIYFLPWKNQMVGNLEGNGGRVTCLNAKNNIVILTKFPALIRYINKHQIQLVHCHLPWAGIVGRFVHRRIRIPLIYTEHNKQERYHRVTFKMNQLTFNWQTKAIAVSDDVKDSIKEHIGPRIPIQTLLNGVNTQKFQRLGSGAEIRQQLGIHDKAILVGTVAVFRFQKRLKEWLQIMREVIDTNPDYYGVIVGDGPLKEELLEEHKRLGLEGKVFFAGLQEEVRPWLEAMDIYMITSEFEGLPIALLEAMSMECTIATTDAGGIKEVIEDRKSGEMVTVEEYKDLVGRLLNLQDADQRQRLGKAAREQVMKHFSLQKMVEELEKLYIESAKK